ncbi:hypothetical protein [Mucilaginibacter paludis]|uniref:Uncharacterized protein n=1 Tax=Mucilaginibacter paludis DSM 18603 TaxID=714943 RepID=H1Y055_9SPHI|nr:hypothetical protein [Mucilaginibacter paludis]EHQ27964.1 hypothetical protein Mucpa_3872 [Mucilaginibacter paludis DSM 18603]
MNTSEILTNANNISLDTAAIDQNKFCQLWPTVKEGLEILAGLIKNPIVKLTINGIIAAGDAIIGKICG